jgi:hypothetical protein
VLDYEALILIPSTPSPGGKKTKLHIKVQKLPFPLYQITEFYHHLQQKNYMALKLHLSSINGITVS